MFIRDENEKRKVYEYEIVEVNQSSAYAVPVDQLKEYFKDPKKHKYLRERINQRTHEVKGNGWGRYYRMWITKEDFEKNVQYNDTLKMTRQKAYEIFNSLPLSHLEEFINNYEKTKKTKYTKMFVSFLHA